MLSLKTLALATAVAMVPAAASASTWNIDASHSEVGFSVKHLMISNVKGRFAKFSGTINADDKDVTKSTVEVEIDANSIDTRDEKRDEHLKSPDFFDTAKNPKITFKSKKVTKAGKGLKVEGDLTMRGVTKPVTLEVEQLTDVVKDPWGNEKRGVVAKAKVNRKDFGINWNKALDGGGVVVGDTVDIIIEAELAKAKDAAPAAAPAPAKK